MTARAIQATFSDWRTVKSRKMLQLVFEVSLEQQAEVLTMLGAPLPDAPQWCAIALMNSPAGPSTQEQKGHATGKSPGKDTPPPAGEHHKDRRPWESLAPQQQAGILCSDGGFQKYVRERTGWIADEQSAAVWLREELGILSRRELEGRPDLAAKLNDIRADFLEWAGRVPVAVR